MTGSSGGQILADDAADEIARDRAFARTRYVGWRHLVLKSYREPGFHRIRSGSSGRLAGHGPQAMRHDEEAHRVLNEILKEAGTDNVLKRADLSPIYAQLSRRQPN